MRSGRGRVFGRVAAEWMRNAAGGTVLNLQADMLGSAAVRFNAVKRRRATKYRTTSTARCSRLCRERLYADGAGGGRTVTMQEMSTKVGAGRTAVAGEAKP